MAIDFSDPVFLTPAEKNKKKPRARRRKGEPRSAPERSARLYVCLDPSQVHLFRFFLEANDNLGIMTVVDRWRAVLLLRFSPHQEQRVREFLTAAGESLPLSVISLKNSRDFS